MILGHKLVRKPERFMCLVVVLEFRMNPADSGPDKTTDNDPIPLLGNGCRQVQVMQCGAVVPECLVDLRQIGVNAAIAYRILLFIVDIKSSLQHIDSLFILLSAGKHLPLKLEQACAVEPIVFDRRVLLQNFHPLLDDRRPLFHTSVLHGDARQHADDTKLQFDFSGLLGMIQRFPHRFDGPGMLQNPGIDLAKLVPVNSRLQIIIRQTKPAVTPFG